MVGRHVAISFFFAFLFLLVACTSEEPEEMISCVTAFDCPVDWFCEDNVCVEFPDSQPPTDKDTSGTVPDADADTDTGTDTPLDQDPVTDRDADADIDADADTDVDADKDAPVDDGGADDGVVGDDSDELLSDEPAGDDGPVPDDAVAVDDTPVTDFDNVVPPQSCGDGKNTVAEGLVLYLRMDEPTLFSTVYDSSTDPTPAKFSKGASLGNTGIRGGAIAFNQDSDAAVPLTAKLDMSGPMSVMGWVYLDPHANNIWPYPVVIKGNGRQANYYVWREADRKLNFGFHRWEETGTGCGAKSTIDIDDSTWHYFAGTYDGTYVRLYVYGTDGALQDQVTSDPCPQEPLPNTRPFTIGQIPPGTEYPMHYYDTTGYLDELRIYNRAISENEINAIRDTHTEYCDDGNETTTGDGCTACQVDAGYICYGSPSTCVPTPAWQCTHSVNICDSAHDYYDSSYSEYYYRSWVGTTLQAVSESSILWTSPAFSTYQWTDYSAGAKCWGTWYNYVFTSGKTVDLNYSTKGAYDPNQCYFQLKDGASGAGNVITTTAATGSGQWPANYSYTGTCLQP